MCYLKFIHVSSDTCLGRAISIEIQLRWDTFFYFVWVPETLGYKLIKWDCIQDVDGLGEVLNNKESLSGSAEKMIHDLMYFQTVFAERPKELQASEATPVKSMSVFITVDIWKSKNFSQMYTQIFLGAPCLCIFFSKMTIYNRLYMKLLAESSIWEQITKLIPSLTCIWSSYILETCHY